MQVGGFSSTKLIDIIERLERLESEKKEIASAMSEIMKDAKNSGLAPKIIRQVLKIRSQDPEQRNEEEVLLEVYLNAIKKDVEHLPIFSKN